MTLRIVKQFHGIRCYEYREHGESKPRYFSRQELEEHPNEENNKLLKLINDLDQQLKEDLFKRTVEASKKGEVTK